MTHPEGVEPNKYRGQCAVCNATVLVGKGTRTVLPGQTAWSTVCLGCLPVPTAPRAVATTQSAPQSDTTHATGKPSCRCATRATPEGGLSLYLCPRHAPTGLVAALGGGE